MPAAAIAALDVALRCNGKMHPAVLVVVAAETWMPLNVFSTTACIAHDVPPLKNRALQRKSLQGSIAR
jgi:hypothetical protein